MNRATLREQIDRLENLSDMIGAISEMSDVEWADGETVKLCVAENGARERPVTFVHGLPPEVLLVGLRAMQSELERQTQRAEVAA